MRLHRSSLCLPPILLGIVGCGTSPNGSTEVENQLLPRTIVASAQDTATLDSAAWSLVDSAGQVLASGTTDAHGDLSATVDLDTALHWVMLRVESSSGEVRTLLSLADGDTLRAGVHLLTEAVVRRVARSSGGFTPPRDTSLWNSLGDSLARSATGASLPWTDLSAIRDLRSGLAETALRLLSLRISGSGLAPDSLVEDLIQGDATALLQSEEAAPDLASVYASAGISSDSATSWTRQLDSLADRDGTLLHDWQAARDQNDSLLLDARLPWLSGSSGEPSRELLLRELDDLVRHLPDSWAGGSTASANTARSAMAGVFIAELQDLSAPPDDTAALGLLVRSLAESAGGAWPLLNPGGWIGEDSALSDLLVRGLRTTRGDEWSLPDLFATSDPGAYLDSTWPMPDGETWTAWFESELADRPDRLAQP